VPVPSAGRARQPPTWAIPVAPTSPPTTVPSASGTLGPVVPRLDTALRHWSLSLAPRRADRRRSASMATWISTAGLHPPSGQNDQREAEHDGDVGQVEIPVGAARRPR
jgi:hypothetical protein